MTMLPNMRNVAAVIAKDAHENDFGTRVEVDDGVNPPVTLVEGSKVHPRADSPSPHA
jgi:hypothetical protein